MKQAFLYANVAAAVVLALSSAVRTEGRLAPRWWESASAIVRVGAKDKDGKRNFSLEPAKLEAQLDEIQKAGFSAVEVFAPALGGLSFSGLDTIDRFRVDPSLGTLDDFKRLVERAHARGLAVISFDNLGYSSIDAVDFLRAAGDVKAGRESRERTFFLWSDRADAPAPGTRPGNHYFFVRPTHLPGGAPGTFYESSKHEFWAFSDRAGQYYWTKWAGVNLAGAPVRLPQYDWGSAEFQAEAERVVRFWMDLGIDGMVIDAVNWYVNYTWELGRRRITNVIASYDNSYSQPEGAGGFHEDPVPWISEGGWNSVQDYGLGIWWEKGSDVIANAISSGDPRPIEPALRAYHDRVVAAGGTLYHFAPELPDPKQRAFAIAVVACVGDLFGASYPKDFPIAGDVTWLLDLKRRHPALQHRSTRRQLLTGVDEKHYAFLRTSADGSERILAVLNFQSMPQRVAVNTSGVDAGSVVDLRTNASLPARDRFEVDLPALGVGLYLVPSTR